MSTKHRLLVGLVAGVCIWLVAPSVTDLLLAQPPPPSLPGTPNQAPIDGGLGLLAAGGAAYAWKRLRNKHTN